MHITADLDHLLRSTADAFAEALHAVLDGDVPRARDVLRHSAARRRLAEVAGDALREQPWVPAPQLADRLQFVDDLARAGDLVDRLARSVVCGEAAGLTPSQRMDVAVLLDAGGRRLRQLLECPVGPAMDPAYRGCGAALFEVVDRGERESSSVMGGCGALAKVLLQASRHATRAA